MPAQLEAKALSYEDFILGYDNLDKRQPPSSLLNQALNVFDYSALESIILLHLDDLDGIQSHIESDPDKTKYPTGFALVRDASRAKPLEERLSPDDPLVLGDNLLLRAIGTLRGIHHVLEHKYKTEGHEIYHHAEIKLQEILRDLLLDVTLHNDITTLTQKHLEEKQKVFNSKLVAVLHETNLDIGLNHPKDYAKLLAYYRDMASTLDPAKSMVTLRQEKINGIELTYTETSHPITEKTAAQKEQLKVMEKMDTSLKLDKSRWIPEPSSSSSSRLKSSKNLSNSDGSDFTEEEKDELSEIRNESSPANFQDQLAEDEDNEDVAQIENGAASNFHVAKANAFQQVAVAFAENVAADDRRLPAQARYHIGPTIKNGYIVNNKVVIHANDQLTHAENWSLRSGTMGYIGTGETVKKSVEYAKENLLQFQQAVKKFVPAKLAIHFSMILTNISWGKQDKMVAITHEAIKQLAEENHRIEYSYLPVNIMGAPHRMQFALRVKQSAKELGQELPSEATDFIDRKSRIEKVGKVVNLIANSKYAINITACASGQDRTGTVQEVAAVMWESTETIKLLTRHYESQIEKAEVRGAVDTMQALRAERDGVLNNLVDKIMMRRAMSGNNVVLGTLSTPGSTGMKNDSKPDNYFPEIINKYFYRKTAKTNKAPPMDEKHIEKTYFPFVDKAALINANKSALEAINNTTDSKVIMKELIRWAEAALIYQMQKEVKTTGHSVKDSVAKALRFWGQGPNAKAKAADLRNKATELVQYLRDNKILENPDQIKAMLATLNDRAKDMMAKFPDKKERGTVFEGLNDLVTKASSQVGIEERNSPRSLSAPRN